MQFTITVKGSSDDAETIESLRRLVADMAPWMVDNVEVTGGPDDGELCLAAGDHLAKQAHRMQECPVYHLDDRV